MKVRYELVIGVLIGLAFMMAWQIHVIFGIVGGIITLISLHIMQNEMKKDDLEQVKRVKS